MKILHLILFLGVAGCARTAHQEQPGAPLPQSTTDRSAILGIWWSPEMFQSAAFQIKDSTIYYPESFAEYKYQLLGDSLFVYRDEGVSASFIVRVTADTLILVTWGEEEVFTRSETQEP